MPARKGFRELERANDKVEESAKTSESEDEGLSIAQKSACESGNKRLLDAIATDSSSSDEGSRVEWSENENDDDPVKRHLKARELAKEKKAETLAREARKASGTRKPRVPRVPKKPETTGVGRIAPKKVKLKKERTYGDDSDESDTLADALPDYFKNRRRAFDGSKDKADNSGLKLPPNYDDVHFSDDERMEDLKEKPDFTDIPTRAPYEDKKLRYSLGVVPAPIAQYLREYQVTGAEFLHEAFVYQKGVILGDDMGLGKTIQVISALTAAFGKTGDERDSKRMRKMRQHPDRPWYPIVLLVCPGSLLSNWQAELKRWGWWATYEFHGSSEDKLNAIEAAKNGRAEIVITTYDTYRLNKDVMNLIQWDCVIADECHRIKERKAEITKAMNEINALCRIGLTGTAIQNNYDELWNLLNWTNPGQFGSLESWRKSIALPLKIGQSHEATTVELARGRKIARQLVQNVLPDFFLRRMKSLIADQLPKKSDRVVFCPLTSEQAQAYETFVGSEIVETISRATEDCDCGKTPTKKRGWCCYTHLSNGDTWQMHVFPAMQTLQKLANHLALLIPSEDATPEQQHKDYERLEMAVPRKAKELYATQASIRHLSNVNFCGKWRILRKLLDFWYKNGDKVLIFSHSVRLLKMLHALFDNTTTFSVSYLDGGMTYDARTQAVDDFNADPNQFVFLISTKAGGVGLNITSANKVVIVDPNWNPSYDLQAQDRAFRIGQTRDVECFRLVSSGTIEEIIYARQIYKQQQANIGYNASHERRYFAGVQENSAKKGEIFGLANIFAYQSENVVLRDIINKTNVAESRAGVMVVGLDSDSAAADDDPLQVGDDNDENSAMSQLADLISTANPTTKSKPKPGNDAVAAILASAGVEYTHENSEVIGTSKIEQQLSRRAEEAGKDMDSRAERVFAASQFSHLDSADEETSEDDDGDTEMKDANGEKRWKHHNPPEDVKRRQFCSMAKHFKMTPEEFALMVESWTQKQRTTVLERFYREYVRGE